MAPRAHSLGREDSKAADSQQQDHKDMDQGVEGRSEQKEAEGQKPTRELCNIFAKLKKKSKGLNSIRADAYVRKAPVRHIPTAFTVICT